MTRPDTVQWELGAFRLDGAQHLLFRDGKLVPLSRKAVDILVVLLESHGQLVEKEALMRRIWPDSFVEESNLAVHISQLRKTLNEGSDSHRIETIPRRGYRFVGEVNDGAAAELSFPVTASAAVETAPPATDAPPWQPRKRPLALYAAGVVVCLVAITILGLLLRERRRAAAPAVAAAIVPLERDSVVLADFANNTGDPVFNTTLRQAMAIELEQSPYLSLVPETRIQRTLRLMGRPADEPLTPDVSREVCQRNQSEAVLDGWIAKLGTQYVLGIRAVNCRTGDHLADLETTAAGKEQVLKALGDATGQLRSQLGESLSTVQRFDTPIEEATTPSLEALQAYSLGKATMIRKGDSALCVPFFQRAIRLDPDFAIAYAALGNAYSNLGEAGLASTSITRAYALRQRVSEREKLYIESHYYAYGIGDLPKAAAIYEIWAATYPDDAAPRTDLAVIDTDLGKYGPDLDEAKAALRIAPDDGQNYANLANVYISLERLGEARATVDQALERKFDSSDLHLYLYDLAFLKGDAAGMERQVTWAAGEPGIADLFLGHSADTLAFAGQLAKAREFTRRAVDSARHTGEMETAAGYQVEAAQREALYGNAAEARRLAEEALLVAHDRDTQYGAALALALSGNFDRGTAIAAHLNRDFPDDTLVQFVYVPTIHGTVALGQKDPALAIRALDAAGPYELGAIAGLLPAYLRGRAYLETGDGRRAQLEFEKIVAHPAVVLNGPLGPLTRLQLARAFLLQRMQPQAKSAYEDFLARWKDADPNIPVLEAAKAEYAKLPASGAR